MSTFTDPRDGQVYKTVIINGQLWLAENLRYKGPVKKFNDWTVEEKEFYFAPNGDRKNIKNYGCLYTWNNALKACPLGWHLPSKEEFRDLLRYSSSDNSPRLQNLRTTTWNRCLWSRTDKYGFGALLSGYYDGGSCYNFGDCTYFWSGMELGTYRAYSLYLGHGGPDVDDVSKGYAFPVRCIKD